MEDTFTIIEGLFDAQMTRTQLIATIAGSIVILFGLIVVAFSSLFRLKGQRVFLKVVRLHTEECTIKADDDEDRIAEKRANPLIRPEFEIVEGPHAGMLVKSSSAGTPPQHELGEVIPGYFFVKSGDVMSKRESRSGIKFGFGFIAVGTFIIFLFKVVMHEYA